MGAGGEQSGREEDLVSLEGVALNVGRAPLRPLAPASLPPPTHAQQQDTLGPRRIAHAPKRRKMPIGGTSCSIATLPNDCSRKEVAFCTTKMPSMIQ